MDKLEIAEKCATTMLANDVALKALGMRIEIPSAGSAEARFSVTENMLNGYGICHGGYLFTLADSAFAYACNAYDEVTLAAAASIEFLRAARLGDELVASAGERHRGGRSGIYDVVITNQDGVEIAIFRGRSHRTKESIL